MFGLKTFSLVALILLLQSCSNASKKYDIVGIWDSECINTNDNNRHGATVIYAKDASFESRSKSKTQPMLLFGTYKASRGKLIKTYIKSNRRSHQTKLPLTQTTDLKWIDNNSILMTIGSNRCTATRAYSN